MKWYPIKRQLRRLLPKKKNKRSIARKRDKRNKSLLIRRLHWGLRIVLLIFVVDVFYLGTIWPDWDSIAVHKAPKSQFILSYEKQRRKNPGLPHLRWYPVRYNDISPHLRRMVVLAEDGRFYTHRGFDLQAVVEAFQYNLDRGRVVYGGSTISQQTVKNLFLSPSRDPLRKWHELVLTVGMEFNLKKWKILELYLNVAEFGTGIYGAEAAARAYWGIHASELSEQQAIELAATLPSPKRHNPQTRTKRFLNRVKKIRGYLERRYN
jgi:monofunctional biosynthetic peptidoglycan transglycosylase